MKPPLFQLYAKEGVVFILRGTTRDRIRYHIEKCHLSI